METFRSYGLRKFRAARCSVHGRTAEGFNQPIRQAADLPERNLFHTARQNPAGNIFRPHHSRGLTSYRPHAKKSRASSRPELDRVSNHVASTRNEGFNRNIRNDHPRTGRRFRPLNLEARAPPEFRLPVIPSDRPRITTRGPRSHTNDHSRRHQTARNRLLIRTHPL